MSARAAKRTRGTARTGREVGQRKATCDGECSGTGVQILLIPGACPEKTDAAMVARVEREARAEARNDASATCQEKADASCLCTGGTYRKALETRIQSVLGGPNNDTPFCKYTAAYVYEKGTCKTIA